NCPSSDATRRLVAGYERVRYVREERPGLNNARNRALHEARHEVVAFTDDDAAPDAGWLRALLRNFEDPLVLCVTGLTMPLELETEAQEWFERYSPFNRGFKRTIFDRTNCNPLAAGRVGAGANMALRRSLLEIIGPFDEALDAGTPTCSGGDTEIFSRILAAGYRIVYDPAALSWHHHRRTWQELLQTIYGYGVGVYALWTRRLLLEGNLGVLILAWGWFGHYQLPALIRSILRRPGSPPLDMLLAELQGCAMGPWAYFSSRRRRYQRSG
ncbi:MAG TPA: glycoside hydrolase family 2, partial [Chloroflexi bacterium]|nr:glycoside hydrolase family 2 [Chloroflexota bacterium]